MLLELVVPKHRVVVVGWVVDDAAAELRLGDDGNEKQRDQNESGGGLPDEGPLGDLLLFFVCLVLLGSGLGSCWVAVPGDPVVSRAACPKPFGAFVPL